MPEVHELITTYIASQPEADQPALFEINEMLAKTYPRARVEMLPTAKGELPIYKDGDTMVGGFSLRAKGPMVYLTDPAVVAKYKPQLGSLAAPGNGACVLYKPTKTLDAVALNALFMQMMTEVVAKRGRSS